ncbi:hypothetical protein EL75_4845 [Escherichia coli]|nr:hypothetical protein EL75_4845 [Escherichia coli]KGM76459.1 hypothetical protein EL80_5002 [Escherichia coli]KGM77050.1 hypothetical protein EL79_5178 [Escherichia coli]
MISFHENTQSAHEFVQETLQEAWETAELLYPITRS